MISETCSVCGTGFEIVFRYQMEERNGGFAFYCSQKCLEKSQHGGDAAGVVCDACSKRFSPDLVSQVLYLSGKRKYACTLDCRSQLLREAQGARLGDFADAAKKASRPALTSAEPPAPVERASNVPPVSTTQVREPNGTAGKEAPAVAGAGTESRAGQSVSDSGEPIANPGASPPSPTSQGQVSPQGPVSSQSPVSLQGPVPPQGPVSQGPVPPQGPVSQGPTSQAPKTTPSKAPARARKEEAAQSGAGRAAAGAPARTSGLMSAIRPEGGDAAGRNDEAGTVIPIVPPLKGEKVPAAVKAGQPRRIAVFNHKGGTGKTTTAVSIAAGLAAKGKRVLLVDTDAQGNVSVSLGAGSERSLYHVLVMGLRVADAVKEVRPGLFLLPSNETLAAAELYLAGRQNRDRVLADRLNSAAGDYDYVVLDCSPSLSLMNQNALVFADSVLVPVACDYLSLVGVRQVLKTVKNVNSLLHHPVQIWGVLPTFFDGRAKICNEAVATLKDHFGDKCLPPIRAAIKVKEAPSVGQTIFEYAAGSNAAEDYGVIVDKIVGAASATAAPAEGGPPRETQRAATA